MGRGAKNYREMRVWESARAFKKTIYDLVDTKPFAKEDRLRDQLREAASSAASQIGEGYGRFEPGDHARYLKMARASLIECQNHLIDAVDRKAITETVRHEHDATIVGILRELDPLIGYLQSPEAKKNVERIKRQTAERRMRRRKANDEL
jgi:four helix bundle protein